MVAVPPSQSPRFDYLTVGHVTRDLLADGSGSRPGGTAFYSALQAARLGLRTLILTQGVPAEIERLLEPFDGELELRVIPAPQTTTFATEGAGAARSQRILAWARPIASALELDTTILHLAPVARETPVSWRGKASFVGITPQGLIRGWAATEGKPSVQPVPLDAASLLGDIPLVFPDSVPLGSEVRSMRLDASTLPERLHAAVISEHECSSCHALFAHARACEAPVAVTAGERPTTVHLPSGSVEQTSLPPLVAARDETGAGDVFAAAFFTALADGRRATEAADFANAAAALRIAGDGARAIASTSAIREAQALGRRGATI